MPESSLLDLFVQTKIPNHICLPRRGHLLSLVNSTPGHLSRSLAAAPDPMLQRRDRRARWGNRRTEELQPPHCFNPRLDPRALFLLVFFSVSLPLPSPRRVVSPQRTCLPVDRDPGTGPVVSRLPRSRIHSLALGVVPATIHLCPCPACVFHTSRILYKQSSFGFIHRKTL